MDTIKKRFQVFLEQSLPVIRDYEQEGKVARINTNRTVDEIFLEAQRLMQNL